MRNIYSRSQFFKIKLTLKKGLVSRCIIQDVRLTPCQKLYKKKPAPVIIKLLKNQ